MFLILFAFAIIESSTPATMEYNAVVTSKDCKEEVLYDVAPNGALYQVGKTYEANGIKYIIPTRKPDYDNPVKDKNGKIRYYPYLPVEKKIKKITTETDKQLRTEIRQLLYNTTYFKEDK